MVASSNGGVFLHKKLKVNNTSSTEMEKPETLFDHGGKRKIYKNRLESPNIHKYEN